MEQRLSQRTKSSKSLQKSSAVRLIPDDEDEASITIVNPSILKPVAVSNPPARARSDSGAFRAAGTRERAPRRFTIINCGVALHVCDVCTYAYIYIYIYLSREHGFIMIFERQVAAFLLSICRRRRGAARRDSLSAITSINVTAAAASVKRRREPSTWSLPARARTRGGGGGGGGRRKRATPIQTTRPGRAARRCRPSGKTRPAR